MEFSVKILLQNRFIRYVIAAGIATIVDVIAYSMIMSTHSEKSPKNFDSIALVISFSLGLIVNFVISKYFVFVGSQLRTETQFFRFAITALAVFMANLLLIRLLNRFFNKHFLEFQKKIKLFLYKHFLVRGVSASIIAFLSYFLHKVFSFQV